MSRVPLSTIIAKAEAELGFPGRLLTWSKSTYREFHPGFVPNANVIVGSAKVWFGDIDVDFDSDIASLRVLADYAQEPVHVLREMDGRFQNEHHPLIDRAVKTFEPRPMGRVYLAGRYSRIDELNRYAEELRQAWGYTVDCRWLQGDHRAEDAQLSEELSKRIATDDHEDIVMSDIFIAFTDEPRSTTSRGGRHVEFGYALANGIRCYRVGPIENVFYSLVPGWPTWAALTHSGCIRIL